MPVKQYTGTSVPYFVEGGKAMVELETMVDVAGMRNVLYALSHIASAKADHLVSHWQDYISGKAWAGMARKLYKLAGSKGILS